MKKSPLALLLATGLILGSSAAAAATLAQHSKTATPLAIVECGFDGEQDGTFEDPAACDTDQPEANDTSDTDTENADKEDGDTTDESATDTKDGDNMEQTGDNDSQDGDNANDQN
jgi:hypothetical protein